MALLNVAGAALDVRLQPAVAGAAHLPPLVFLHEGLGSADRWRDFPDVVRAAAGGPASLVYSRHGNGRSGPAARPRPITYLHHEADVVLPQLLARLSIERPILIGHSDGASIALLHAGGGHPLAGLVLMAPHVFVEEKAITGIQAVSDAYLTTDLRQRLARHHDDVDATFISWRNVWLSPEFRSWNIEDRLPAITCPVLLIQGDADQYGTEAQLDAIQAGLRGPSCRLLLPGVRHAPHLESRAATQTAVVAFINQLPASGDREERST